MLLLRTFAPCLLLSFLAQQVSLSSGKRGTAARRVPSSRDKAATGRGGKFSTEDMQCTWRARDVGETVTLSVRCESPEARVRGGETDLSCDYIGKPRSCPAFGSKPGSFWKQVSRALRRLDWKLCKDERALVMAGGCKRAPRDSHFKLDISSSVASAQAGEPNTLPPPRPRPRNTTAANTSPAGNTRAPGGTGEACTERVDHRKTAEEYCRSSWTSVCFFFMSMLQSGDC